MLMTKLKSEEVIGSLASGKVFIINCHGCKEVGFPEEEAKALQKKLEAEGKVVGILTTDYVCNPDELALRLRAPMAKIAEAAFTFSTRSPLRSDQMKANRPSIDSRKAPSRLSSALSIDRLRCVFVRGWRTPIGVVR